MLWQKFQLNWQYALGEFSIVVLGVLAAFWVERCNAERNDRLLEIEYVQSLLRDLKADSESIDTALRRSEQFARSGLTILESIREGQSDVSGPHPSCRLPDVTPLRVICAETKIAMED